MFVASKTPLSHRSYLNTIVESRIFDIQWEVCILKMIWVAGELPPIHLSLLRDSTQRVCGLASLACCISLDTHKQDLSDLINGLQTISRRSPQLPIHNRTPSQKQPVCPATQQTASQLQPALAGALSSCRRSCGTEVMQGRPAQQLWRKIPWKRPGRTQPACPARIQSSRMRQVTLASRLPSLQLLPEPRPTAAR